MIAPVQAAPPCGDKPASGRDLEDYLADVGDRVRAERQHRGWTQAHLAKRAGIGLATVKRIEAGGVWLRPLVLASWALGIELDYLLSLRWETPSQGPVVSLSPRQVDVLSAAAGGAPLSVVARRLGMTRPEVASHMSRVYRRLDVAGLPEGERRAAAVRVASRHGLLHAQ